MTTETINRATDRVRDEMAKSKDGQLQFVGEIVTALLQVRPEAADQVADGKKNLVGALGAIRKAAVHGVAPPDVAAKAICGYYGIKDQDMRTLAVEINCAMMGAEPPHPSQPDASQGLQPDVPPSTDVAADPFDLDALMGVL